MQLVISDAHAGLRAAMLIGSSWQRCRVHFLRSVHAQVPKGSAEMVTAAIRTIFAQPGPVHVAEQLDTIATMLGARLTEPGEGELVFCTAAGQALDAANVRRSFRTVCTAAGIGPDWTPRELRHTFVSLMSDSGVPVEEIARLAGHATSRTTELVYRHQLRPIMEKGAEAMDHLFPGAA